MFIIGYILINAEFILMNAFGIIMFGIAIGRCGWFMHEGGHHSLTGNIKIDKLLQKIFYVS